MVEAQRRAELIQQYKDGYLLIVEALDGISEQELDAREGEGEWSPREVVHHLADSEMTSAIRLRLLIAEDVPHIVGYDQEEFARRLYYDRPIEASLAAFKAARATTAELLGRMSEAEWAKSGTHSESGPYAVTGWLEIYAQHAVEHADQIKRARAVVQ
jgi:hypothetical protein